MKELFNESVLLGKYKVQGQNADGMFLESAPGFGIHVEVSFPFRSVGCEHVNPHGLDY